MLLHGSFCIGVSGPLIQYLKTFKEFSLTAELQSARDCFPPEPRCPLPPPQLWGPATIPFSFPEVRFSLDFRESKPKFLSPNSFSTMAEITPTTSLMEIPETSENPTQSSLLTKCKLYASNGYPNNKEVYKEVNICATVCLFTHCGARMVVAHMQGHHRQAAVVPRLAVVVPRLAVVVPRLAVVVPWQRAAGSGQRGSGRRQSRADCNSVSGAH